MSPTPETPTRALMHRWFVQYNPIYLVSATLVLGGIWLLSREAAAESSALGQIGVAALAEVYALALIGGAAMLWRIARRRAAVMLGLLAVLYQGDLTMHAETSAFLGDLGRIASAGWLLLFVLKLELLVRALQLRVSLSARVVPWLGAVGIAVLPHVLRDVGSHAGAQLVAGWLFAVGAAGLWTRRAVRGAIAFDVRGRRSVRATWLVWAGLVLAHAGYWAADHHLHPATVCLPLLLLGLRAARRETAVWALVGGTLAVTAILRPSLLSTVSWLAAAALALRALRAPTWIDPAQEAPSAQPYRGPSMPPPAPAPPRFVLARAAPGVFARFVAGALGALYIGAWTHGWSGGAWPAHVLWLDLALLLACVALAWRTRRWTAAWSTTVAWAHLVLVAGYLPRTSLGWGALSVGLGFGSLLLALAASWRGRLTRPAAPAPPPEP